MRAFRLLKTLAPGRRVCAALAVFALGAALVVLALSCTKAKTPSEPRTPRDVETPAYLKDTIGELARFSGREDIPVQGYGFVTGLDGTGTKAMPPGIRQQVLEMMRRNKVDKAEEIITSPDTAVVMVSGWMPPGINRGELFDLEVHAIPTTDTASLEGGFLLECELTRVLSARGVEQRSEPLALGRGSIFVSPFAGEGGPKKTGDPRVGRVLAGGKALKTRHFRLVLLTPSVRSADQIVRLVNARFPGAAKGSEDPGRVDLETPREFVNSKAHFLDLVGAVYLRETPDARDQRVQLLIDALESGKDMDRVALCLEAFGSSVAPRLHALAEGEGAAVRFYAARTLAGLQDAFAVHILERIATDDTSELQEAAAEALGGIRSGVGLGVLGRALGAKSARVRVAAWQAMARLAPRTFVARNFEDKFALNVVTTRAEPFVYIARTLKPQITLFGDVKVLPPVLAETPRVTASAVPGAEQIRLISRRHGRDVHVEAPLDLKGLIEKMASPLPGEDEAAKPPRTEGLDLGYSDVVGLVHEISRKHALSAPVVLQPLGIKVLGDRPVARPISPQDEAPK
jgi:flagellar basal body P-ring protein FlgI